MNTIPDPNIAAYRNIGLDLGTTNSAIHYTDFINGQPAFSHSLRFPYSGKDYVPTLIYEGKETLFGWEAENIKNPNASLKCSDFKMGLLDPALCEASKDAVRRFYQFMYRAYRDGAYNVPTPEQEKENTFTYATYPVRFPDVLRDFLREAICEAGFPNVTMISEAEAAMSYACSRRNENAARILDRFTGPNLNIMAVDSGAGTTDVSVFEYDIRERYVVRMMGAGVNPDLSFGGSEIENRLVTLYEDLCGAGLYDTLPNLNCDGDPEVGRRTLRAWARNLKEGTLSARLNNDEKALFIPGDLMPTLLQTNPDAAKDILWGREQFETVFRDYLGQFPAIIENALKCAGKRPEEIDVIVLTGGNSIWYFIDEMLTGEKSHFPGFVERSDGSSVAVIRFPGEESVAVAIGASMYRRPNLSDRLLTLRKADLPGSLISARAQLAFWPGGITNLQTGESVRLSCENPDPQRWEVSAIRYGEKVCRGLTCQIDVGHDKLLVILAEDRTLVFTDYHETVYEQPAEWLKGWLYHSDAYNQRSPFGCQWITSFECRNSAGEEVCGYRFDRVADPWPRAWIDPAERSCIVFTDAKPCGFFMEGLCPAMGKQPGSDDELVGYIDPSGKWAIPPIYRSGMPFYHAVARVLPIVDDGDQWPKIGIIDYAGKGRFKEWSFLFLGVRPWSITAMDEKKASFLLENRLVWSLDEDRFVGVGQYSINGIPRVVDYIRPPSDGKLLMGTSLRDVFSVVPYPHSIVEEGYLLGYASASEYPADDPDHAPIPVQYKDCKDFHEGAALVRDSDSKWGLLSHSGKIITTGWDALYICQGGIVVGRMDRLFRPAQWYRANIDRNQDFLVSCSKITSEEALRLRAKRVDSSEDGLTPPWIRFPDSNAGNNPFDEPSETFQMFQTKETEFYQSFADGFYTVQKDGRYRIHRCDGTLLTERTWQALWSETEYTYEHPLIGNMTDEGWNLFHHGALCVQDGEKWGLLGESGEMLMPAEYDEICLYERIGVASGDSEDRSVVFDYSGRIICEKQWEYYRYDGTSDYLPFAYEGRLCILDTRNGEITRTDYPAFIPTEDRLDEESGFAFTAVHRDMLAIYTDDHSFAAFLDPKGQAIPLSDIPQRRDLPAPLKARWAGKNGPWYLYCEQNKAVWIVTEDG